MKHLRRKGNISNGLILDLSQGPSFISIVLQLLQFLQKLKILDQLSKMALRSIARVDKTIEVL